MLHVITSYNKNNSKLYDLYSPITFDMSIDFDTYLKDSEIFKEVIREIDNAEIVMDQVIKTPFGVTTIEHLSGGSKVLLTGIFTNDRYVCFDAAGDNVFDLALKLCNKYNLEIKMFLTGAPETEDDNCTFEINGEVYRNLNFGDVMCHVLYGEPTRKDLGLE